MKKLKKYMGLLLTLVMCLGLTACQSKEERVQTDILYAVFGANDVQEYPIEYTGDKKTAEELAHELSELTGLDFIITASKTEDGYRVDWAANSTLIAGLDHREQKKDFFFFDQDTLRWFMMDSLWRTLTKNLNAENIYYTMDGGKTLAFEQLYANNAFPSDTPYMGSEFYFAHDDVTDSQTSYQGFWKYPDGSILEINGDRWNLYTADGLTLLSSGPVGYTDDAAYLMNDDGSSGGGIVSFDENNHLTDFGTVLTYYGESLFEEDQ